MTDGSETIDVSIIIPVYNETDRIASALGELTSFLKIQPYSAEIIIADDGSSDDSATKAAQFHSDNGPISVLRLPHRGKASAVLSGLKAAKGEIVGFMDVDLATPPEILTTCIEKLRDSYDVAIASREGTGANRVDEPVYRHVMGRIFNHAIQFLLLPGIDDTQCGFKFFTRRAAEVILDQHQLYRTAPEVASARVTAFDVELLYIARRNGLDIAVIPVTWQYGEHSKVNPLTDTLHNARDVARIRINGWLGRYS